MQIYAKIVQGKTISLAVVEKVGNNSEVMNTEEDFGNGIFFRGSL